MIINTQKHIHRLYFGIIKPSLSALRLSFHFQVVENFHENES